MYATSYDKPEAVAFLAARGAFLRDGLAAAVGAATGSVAAL